MAIRKQGITDTQAGVAFLCVCLCALMLPVSATGAQAPPASPDPYQAATAGGVQTPERLPRADDFSDPLNSGGEGPEMVVVPAGTFRMGCLQLSGCYDEELPVREVTIPGRFALSKHEITFADWDACVEGGGCDGYLPYDKGWGRGRRPVIHVNWDDAQSYVLWLSRQTGETYRLPSEAEWEYAARAGTETRFNWGDDFMIDLANCRDERCRDAFPNTAPVGSFPANAWGLHDIHGNVNEWVQDCWNGDSYEGAPTDGGAWVVGEGDCRSRMLRGGAWSSTPEGLRSATRIRNYPLDRLNTVGFRVARALPPVRSGNVPLFPSAADESVEGFVRVLNHSEESGEVSIVAFDDSGGSYGPIALTIEAGAAVQFNSGDLERGNPAKGLPEGIGIGMGDWRLQWTTVLDVEVLSYIRTPDGFLTAMGETVPASDDGHRISFFNPGRNRDQVSYLRLVNSADEDSKITITGADDDGRPGGTVSLSLAAGESRTISSQQLEAGGGDLDGELGAGRGKWRLAVVPSAPVLVMNLLESPTGHLANLSTSPAAVNRNTYFLPLFPAKSSLGREGFLRVINLSGRSGDVWVYGIDDHGNRRGPVSLRLDAGAAAHINSTDLEDGSYGKGLNGSIGAGAGDWRLELTSELEFEALAYVRTGDGFVTAIHDAAPRQAGYHRIAVFNPAANRNQVSLLRLVNPTSESAWVSIRGIDDAGEPGGLVELPLPAGQARTVSAWDLESGGGDLEGALGEGAGKWQLEVASEQPLDAMSLLESPSGHLTNLSSADFRRMRLATARDVFDELISSQIAQSSCVSCHVAGGEAGDTRLTLVPDTTAGHAGMNREAFADFLREVEAGESLMLAKIRGDAAHGGGIQLEQYSAGYATVARFLRLVVEESSASFDSITYSGSATIGNGERMAARDLLVEVPERTLIDDIAVSIGEAILPAALPSGVSQMADPVEFVVGDGHQGYLNGPLTVTMTYPEGTRNDGDIVVLRYEPTMDRWFGATVKSHDAEGRTVAFETSAFGHFVLARATSPLPGEFTTGFRPSRHGFSIDNDVEYHTAGGNSFGMSAYAIYHFTSAHDDLNDRWGRTVQTLVATLAQSTTPAIYVNSEWWRSFRFDSLSAIKQTMRLTRSPVVLMLSRLGDRHAVVAYGYDGDEFLIYDPDYPERARRTTGGGRQYRSGGGLYSVSHAVHLNSIGRVADFERLTDAASAGFSDSSLLSVDVLDGQEVRGRKLAFSGELHGALDQADVRLWVYDGRYRRETARKPDGTFDGTMNVHYGENAVAFLAGRSAETEGARLPASRGGRYWELPSAALVRRVTGMPDRAALRITIGWESTADLDVFVQEPEDGEILFWGNRETVNTLTLDGDDRGTNASAVERTETAILPEPWDALEGLYRVFVHQYDDHELNRDVNVTVDVELQEGHRSRNFSYIHGSTIPKGQYGLGGAATVGDLLNASAVEVARVDPGRGQICFIDPASGRFDACVDGTKPGLGAPQPLRAINGDMASAKPAGGAVPDLPPGADVAFTIDSVSLPASDCTYESPWRACYHTRNAAANDLVEVNVRMPQGSSGAWHGAWCAKATPEGLCEGRHDSTDSIDKRFAGNGTIRFVTRAPRDASAFWIVGEIRECEKSRCLWPTDYTAVEFHHIEIDVGAESARADRAKLFWLDGGLVRRSGLDGSSVESVVDFGMDVGHDLAIDLPGGKAYLIDATSGTIRRANLDGSSVETVVSRLRRSDGIALDGQGKMYFAAQGIYRANLDGSHREMLIPSLPWPQDIGLDLTNSMIYWVDHASSKIQRARLDGSGLKDLVTRGLRLPDGIALDVGGGKMYWTDRDAGKIQRSNLDGSLVQAVITGLQNPQSIAFHSPESMIYWAEPVAGTIRRARTNGSGMEVVVDSVRRGGPVGLSIVVPD